ncbi:MAG TPA: hypothetical protein DCQ76_05560 [Ruminococcaceae bacterium]|nr:hypothetical protein [Oscillospiraceae bacterium]
MDIKRCTIDSQDILRRENARTFFICLLSFALSLLCFGAASYGVYLLYAVSGPDKGKYSSPVLFLLYALFSSEVTFSLFALSAVSYNRKRWFYRNASEKAPVSYLFAGERFSVRLKVFYFYFFKKLMTVLCLIACEIPFLLCLFVFYRELSDNGMYKSVFIGATALCAVLFLLGLYFGAALSKTYWLCEKVYWKDKKCSVALAVKKSKSLTEGNRFRLVNYNISFVWRVLFCVLIIPLFYTAPYISQSNGLLCCEFLGKYRQSATFPVVFMKPQKT